MIACTLLAPRATAHRAPTVLMEVLSDDPTRDLGVKWQAYQAIETLQHYVIVERDRPRLEVRDRRPDGWDSRTLDDFGAALALPALDLAMPLAKITPTFLCEGGRLTWPRSASACPSRKSISTSSERALSLTAPTCRSGGLRAT